MTVRRPARPGLVHSGLFDTSPSWSREHSGLFDTSPSWSSFIHDCSHQPALVSFIHDCSRQPALVSFIHDCSRQPALVSFYALVLPQLWSSSSPFAPSSSASHSLSDGLSFLLCCVGSSGRAVERRTVNRGDGGSIPPTAVSKLKQFLHPTFACVFQKRH